MLVRDFFIPEYQKELKSTRRMLERVPMEKADWKPHEKSMTLGELAKHVAEIPNWMTLILTTDDLDFKKWYSPITAETNEELLKTYDEISARAMEELKEATDETFHGNWTMRVGDRVFFTRPRIAVVRDFPMNHLYHHRAQLSVYLRLLDVPVPGMYGPTADERF